MAYKLSQWTVQTFSAWQSMFVWKYSVGDCVLKKCIINNNFLLSLKFTMISWWLCRLCFWHKDALSFDYWSVFQSLSFIAMGRSPHPRISRCSIAGGTDTVYNEIQYNYRYSKLTMLNNIKRNNTDLAEINANRTKSQCNSFHAVFVTEMLLKTSLCSLAWHNILNCPELPFCIINH